MDALPFEEVRHTADWSLRATGRDFPELLVHLAQGMLHLMRVIPAREPARRLDLTVAAPDEAGLLVRWLEEILFLVEAERVTCTGYQVRRPGPQELQAELEVTAIARQAAMIKAVTYHGLEIHGSPDGLQATVTFDV